MGKRAHMHPLSFDSVFTYQSSDARMIFPAPPLFVFVNLLVQFMKC